MTQNEILAGIKVRTQRIRTLNGLVLKLEELQREFKISGKKEISGMTINDLAEIANTLAENRSNLGFERADLNRMLETPLEVFA
jgi:hypothetical protein